MPIADILNMKLIKLFVAIILVSGFSACNNKSETTKSGSSNSTALANNSTSITDKPLLNNPVLMNGSSFGHFFQSLYKIGRFEDLVKFTASQTLNEIGKDKILDAYKSMEFAYKLELKSKQDNPDSTITLNYISHQFATPKVVRMIVTVENDSVKLVNGDFVTFY